MSVIELVSLWGSGIAMSEAEVACVVEVLERDEVTAQQLMYADRDDEGARELFAELYGRCVRRVGFAGEFAAAVNEQSGGTLSSEQMACLAEGYGSLTSAEHEALVQAGLEPDLAAPEIEQRLRALFASCEVEPPVQLDVP